ncbi:MarR family winged helix-turn-helix transcriptional regulator [Roseobacter sp. YSTF-M11]|uniref:MarR family winged helix-turn-helix transcriptional regulator n=1 Tax=Roseobacter insulae TaxID=2859783 RepID=A0A9X1FSK7_9RHOB|nr:MarR family winged helix-turn-helix transcriptional regulator [Roseobacter insulae]MBW4706360.1 MarR family winged helix-turn-helix transcriptional regulator [Roseobacter insulae]
MENGNCICTSLRRAARFSSELYDDALAPSGLKVTMYRLLKQIRDREFESLTELADHLDLERSTLGRNIKVLERRGLVARHQGADERAMNVELTQSGEDALAEAEPLWFAAQKEMRSRLDDSVDDLLRLLDQIEA